MGEAEESLGVGAGCGVGQMGGDVGGGLPHGEPVVPISPPFVEGVQGPGQVPDGGMPLVDGGGVLGGEQAGMLGVEPGQRR
jgi:hypothetical protein